jgi:hypothetical protein
MDPAILSATSGLMGSVLGATSSIVATWLSRQDEWRVQARTREAAKREALYSEFIAEASKRMADALGHEATGPEVIVALYAAVGRMRLMSSREVIDAAERLVRLIIETYSSANLSFAELRESIRDGFTDPLSEFGEACRAELALLLGEPTPRRAATRVRSDAWPPTSARSSEASSTQVGKAEADTPPHSIAGRLASNPAELVTTARVGPPLSPLS